MLNYYIDQEKKETYYQKLKQESKKLKPKAKQFIEDVLYVDTNINHKIGHYAMKKIQEKLDEKEGWKLEEIFPKDLYPALDLMIGKEFREIFLKACKKMIKFPYTTGYYRRMIRTYDYKAHFSNMWKLLGYFATIYVLDLDIEKILKGEYDKSKYYSMLNKYYICIQIDDGNKNIIQLIKDMLLSENNTNILRVEIFQGIFCSDNKVLVELTAKLLLAAKLQEGLRQSICENIDCGLQENFDYMFGIIYDNDLARFSSVKRAIATFTGIGESFSDRITKKQLELIQNVIKDDKYSDKLLKSNDNIEITIGLWRKGSIDIKLLIKSMDNLVKTEKRHAILLVSYYLNIIQNENYSRNLAKNIIKKYAKEQKDYDKNDALEIIACYIYFISGDSYWYSIKTALESNVLKLENYYKDEKEAREFFDIFEIAMLSMNKKEEQYSPCIFPWYSVAISKEKLAEQMAMIAILVKGDLVDRMIDYIKQLSSYHRGNIVEILLKNPNTKKQKDMVVKLLSDFSVTTDTAYEIIKNNNFAREYIKEIEDLLRLKSPDVRANLIKLLYEQKDEDLLKSIQKLSNQKDVNKRLAALDLSIKFKNDKKDGLDKLNEIINSIKEPTSSEQVLIEQFLGGKANEELIKELYDTDYDLRFDIELKYKGQKKSIKKPSLVFSDKKLCIKEITIDNDIKISEIFTKSTKELLEIIKKLNALYERYENYEYKTAYNVDVMLGNTFSAIKYQRGKDSIKNYPLSEVWEEFYKTEIKDFKILYQLNELTHMGNQCSNSQKFNNLAKNILGFDIYELFKEIQKEKLKYFGDNYNSRQGFRIINLLYYEYMFENKKYLFDIAKYIMSYVYQNFDRKIMFDKARYYWQINDTFLGDFNLGNAIKSINLYTNDEDFKEAYALKYGLNQEYNKAIEEEMKESERKDKINKKLSDGDFISIIETAKAIEIGFLEKEQFYVDILESDKIKDKLRVINNIINNGYENNNILYNYEFCINDNTLNFIKEESQKIIDYMVDLELKRGDTPTKYSQAIHSINRIEGIDNLIRILKALGNLTLDRNSWYWSGGDTKKSTLSHLLKVCHPKENETAKELKKALKGTDIKNQRLVELAMYSPQWIPILEEYLGWKGLASGCYYFQAHMSDVSKNKESLFAKYTPISIEDLAQGAFDIDWFKSAYEELGKKNFDMLYESAKYISDGAKHSRARKFADAVLGNLKIKETQKQIEEKRNKDLLASYSLIPFEKDKDADMLKRYKFIQKFLKDSKQFGSQRRASEAKAVEISLENLARNAGFSDVTRLTCSMETNMIQEIQEYFAPKQIGDITAYIEIDELGKSAIVYQKDGKILKSLPAKYKKDKTIEEIKEIHKNLKDQYTRSKKMLEEAMEDGVEFYSYEIDNLIKNNKVISPMLKDLVIKVDDNLGFYKDKKIVDIDGKSKKLKDDQTVKIAHALDLYNSNKWADYQKYLFDNKIKQQFKQVFRELYVKTQDEKGKDTSLRYAGNQVQPAKCLALLKTRRWGVDSEEGLQKVYYKKNIIAKIYALADWFSPADIEAPTLEWVEFYDRKTFKKILIDDVPDLIFTEVMRDVDLVVSVAHVGGVDPQTSHSTMEMRKAIIQFNLPLFNLNNVNFTDKHAVIKGKLAEYTVHLGSGLVHQKAGAVINVLPVHSQHRGKLFLPFVDEDPKTAEIMSKIILFAEDEKIKDPSILEQIR